MISMISAHGNDRVVGYENRMPWHNGMKSDLRRFREHTLGHTVVMGRKTYESIGHPLPDRLNVVMSSDRHLEIEGCKVVNDKQSALEIMNQDDESFVIGGEKIYRLFLPEANRLYVTKIDAELEGDAFFVEIDENEWKLSERADFPSDDENLYNYSFLTYDRIR